MFWRLGERTALRRAARTTCCYFIPRRKTIGSGGAEMGKWSQTELGDLFFNNYLIFL
jgi:hypothetical protein